jgi:hypothetical protein
MPTSLPGQDMFTEERLYFCFGRVPIHRGSVLLILLPNMIKEFRPREAGLSVLPIARASDKIIYEISCIPNSNRRTCFPRVMDITEILGIGDRKELRQFSSSHYLFPSRARVSVLRQGHLLSSPSTIPLRDPSESSMETECGAKPQSGNCKPRWWNKLLRLKGRPINERN